MHTANQTKLITIRDENPLRNTSGGRPYTCCRGCCCADSLAKNLDNFDGLGSQDGFNLHQPVVRLMYYGYFLPPTAARPNASPSATTAARPILTPPPQRLLQRCRTVLVLHKATSLQEQDGYCCRQQALEKGHIKEVDDYCCSAAGTFKKLRASKGLAGSHLEHHGLDHAPPQMRVAHHQGRPKLTPADPLDGLHIVLLHRHFRSHHLVHHRSLVNERHRTRN